MQDIKEGFHAVPLDGQTPVLLTGCRSHPVSPVPSVFAICKALHYEGESEARATHGDLVTAMWL